MSPADEKFRLKAAFVQKNLGDMHAMLPTDLKLKLISHSDYKERLRVASKRPSILVALTNYCNFGCHYCATKNYRSKPMHMQMALIKNLLNGCNRWKITPTFGVSYEPFLHPQIDTIIKMVNDAGLQFRSNTNGSRLQEKLYGLPMDLTISLSENQNDFQYSHAPMHFAKYQAKINKFVDFRIKHSVRGSLTFQFADYDILESENLDYGKEIKSAQAMAVKMQRLARYLDLDMPFDQEAAIAHIQKRIPIEIYRQNGCQISLLSTKIMPATYEAFCESCQTMPAADSGYCDACYVMMSVQADGGVAFCCADPTAKTVFHHLKPDEDLKALWFSEKFNQLRAEFSAFQPPHPFCFKCLYPVSEHIKPLLTIYAKETVAHILSEFGVTKDLPWYQFEN